MRPIPTERCLWLTFIAVFALTFASCESEPQSPAGIADDAGSLLPASMTLVTTLYYGDFSLDGSSKWLPGTWDVTAGDVTITYEADLSGAPNNANGGWAAANVGLFTPTTYSGARMVGFLWDGDNSGIQFPTYPDRELTLDLDDKFNAQALVGGVVQRSSGEAAYDVLCASNKVETPFGSGSSYGIWFDRDGVDPFQDDNWGAVNDGTYNTGGTYPVELQYRVAADASNIGTLCALHAPEEANVDAPGGYGVPTGFTRLSSGSDPLYEYYPAGVSWTPADPADLSQMEGLVEGSSGAGAIEVKNVTITGPLVLQGGMATGGGWFIPEPSNAHGITTDGSKATFGFNAKQKNGNSSGQLTFQYKTDALNLNSTTYDWVNVSNTQVMFEGTGELNGMSDYRFRVRAVDGDKSSGADRFEIRIWTGTDDFLSPTHRAEGDLGGGQVVVHKK